MRDGLKGARLLVVEDDFLLLTDLEATLTEAGAEIAASCQSVEDGLSAAGKDGVDAAVLDVRIGREVVTPIAEELTRRKIPFLFYTGQVNTDPVLSQWPDCTVLSKPATPHMLVAAITRLLPSQHKAGLPIEKAG